MIVIEKTKHPEICSLAISNLIVLAVRVISVCIAIFRNLHAWLKALLVDPEAALQGHGCTVQPCATLLALDVEVFSGLTAALFEVLDSSAPCLNH